MNKINSLDKIIRHPKAFVSPVETNNIHLRNPLATVWLSVLFPGFGHMFMGSYIKGFLLIIWEIVINMMAKVNLGILYTFHGKFDLAKASLDKRWVFLYLSVFAFAIWDSYRQTVDLNKVAILSDRDAPPFHPSKMNSVEINYLDKTNPWVAAVWSALMPGMGHVYVHRLATGFFVLAWWIAIAYYSNVGEAIYYSAIGAFEQAKAIAEPQWLLFMPSLYWFAIYDSYSHAVEYNKLFEFEQASFFRGNYQSKDFQFSGNGVDN